MCIYLKSVTLDIQPLYPLLFHGQTNLYWAVMALLIFWLPHPPTASLRGNAETSCIMYVYIPGKRPKLGFSNQKWLSMWMSGLCSRVLYKQLVLKRGCLRYFAENNCRMSSYLFACTLNLQDDMSSTSLSFPKGLWVCSERGSDPSCSFGRWRHLPSKEEKEA